MKSGHVSFVALLTAATVSQAGTRMSNLAVPWLVLTETHSPVLTGLVGTAEIAPYVVLQILSSPLVDRLGGHRVALVGNLVAGLSMAAIPLAWHAGWHQLWIVLALMFVTGLARGPGDTAASILLPPVAERAGIGIDRATALSEGTRRVAGLLGAPAAGVLITAIGPVNVVAFDAASFLACAALLTWVPVTAGLTERNDLGYLRQLRNGFAFVRKHPLLRSISGMVLFTNLADAAMSGVLLLLWVERHYGSAARVGMTSAVFGASAVAGTAVMVAIGSRLPRRWTFAVTFLIAGAPRFAVLALPAPFAVVLVVWALSGVTAGAINPVLGAAEYEAIPRALQARVLATVNALAWAGIPFGALLAGVLVEATGLSTALVVGAVLYLSVTLDPFLRRSWDLMNRSEPPAVGEPDAGKALAARSPS
jgi:MFS family permease